jgi:hypothetical protein
LNVEAVFVGKRVGSLESSAVPNRVTIVESKGLGCVNGNCLLGIGNLNRVFPVTRVELLSMGLNELLSRDCPLKALLVKMVHLSVLLADVHLSHAKRFRLKAGSFTTFVVPTIVFGMLFFVTVLLLQSLTTSDQLSDEFLLTFVKFGDLFGPKLLFRFFFGLTGCLRE